MKPLLCPRHHRQGKLAVKTILACKSSQQFVLSLVSLECFTLSFSSLCVRRRGLLYILLLSGKKVHWDPL